MIYKTLHRKQLIPCPVDICNNALSLCTSISNRYIRYQTDIYDIRQIYTISNRYIRYQTDIYDIKQIYMISNRYIQYQTDIYDIKQIYTISNRYIHIKQISTYQT